MNDTIILIVGASGTGKTTIANELSKLWGFKQVESYTTRPPRFDGETGHTFISDLQFDNIRDDEMVAYTKIDEYRYCATKEQIEENDIYVIDLTGVVEFLRKYDGDKTVKVVYLYSSRSSRFNRMLDRGDTIVEASNRLEIDEVAFSRDRADDILGEFNRRDVLKFSPTDKLHAATKIYNFINNVR